MRRKALAPLKPNKQQQKHAKRFSNCQPSTSFLPSGYTLTTHSQPRYPTAHEEKSAFNYYTKMLPHDLCSKIQNAFRARHQKLAVNHNTQNLGILSILLRAGFISSITRGTIHGPNPEQFHKAKESERRIWADLKYRDDQPVLSNMELISLPSRRVFLDLSGIRSICSGRRAGQVTPLGMGEVAMVKTQDKEHEWLEAREALQMRIAGEVVCRAR